MPSAQQMQYLEELINQAAEQKQGEKRPEVSIKTNKKIVVSRAFINRMQQANNVYTRQQP